MLKKSLPGSSAAQNRPLAARNRGLQGFSKRNRGPEAGHGEFFNSLVSSRKAYIAYSLLVTSHGPRYHNFVRPEPRGVYDAFLRTSPPPLAGMPRKTSHGWRHAVWGSGITRTSGWAHEPSGRATKDTELREERRWQRPTTATAASSRSSST